MACGAARRGVGVHVVDLDAGNAGVVSVALSDRSRGTLFDVRPIGDCSSEGLLLFISIL